MADKELSTLTAASLPLDGTELHYVVQGGNSRQVSGSAIVGISHTQAWSTITATPTTISGYGITDAQAKNSNLTTISSLTPASGGFMVGDGSAWAVESGATVRASLGLTIGSDVQGYDADLTTLGGLAKTDGNVIIGNGTSWTVESGSTLRASIGVAIGSDVQAYNAKLSSLAGLTLASGDLVYATGANAIAALNVGLDGQVLRIEGGLPVWATATGTGDMAGAIYDPNNKASDAFSMDNMVEGTSTKIMTATERTKLDGIEAGAQVNLSVGTTTGTVAAGDDSRITGALQAANNLSDLDDAELAAGNLNLIKRDTVSALTADSILAYTAGTGKTAVVAGQIVEAQGYRYSVAASDATDYDLITAGSNLVGNPSFEQDFTGWSKQATTVISSDAHSGTKAASVANGSSVSAGLRSDVVPVAGGVSYSVSAWLKGDVASPDSNYMSVYWFKVDGSPASSPYVRVLNSGAVTTSYQQYSGTVVAPADAATAWVSFAPIATALNTILLVDDVSLVSGVKLYVQPLNGTISPQMLGAKADDPGDGTGTIDTTVIRAAIAKAKAVNATVVGSGKYRIDGKIVFNWRCDFGECDFIATGDATTGVAVEISSGSADIPTDRFDGQTKGHKFVLPNVTNTAKVSGSGVWTGTGLRVVNAHNLDIYEGQVTGFETGYDYYAYQNASAYNRVYCGFSNNNKRGRIVRASNHTSAWINEYEWYSNRYYLAANEFTAGTQIPGCYHLYMYNEGGATYLGGIMNNHKFYGGSWEGNGPEYHIRCQAAYTTFHDIRLEGSDGQRIKFDHQKDPDGSYNVLAFGRGVDLATGLVITEDAGVKGNKLYSSLGASRINGAAAGKSVFVIAPGRVDTAAMKGLSSLDSALTADEDTLYTWEIGDKAIGGKARLDAHNSIYMDPSTGSLYFGNGTSAALDYIQKSSEAGTIGSKANWSPLADVTYNLGSSSRRWKYTASLNFLVGLDRVLFTSGRGSPEGSVTAGIGSLYTDSTGGKLYVKETGTGNTGWVMK